MELAKKIKTRLSEGVNMRKWLSNSKELMTEFQNDPQFSESPQQPSNLPSSVTEEEPSATRLPPSCLRSSMESPNGHVNYDLFCGLEECRDKCYHEEKHTKHRSKVL